MPRASFHACWALGLQAWFNLATSGKIAPTSLLGPGVAIGANDVGERVCAGVVVVQGEESALAVLGEAFDDGA